MGVDCYVTPRRFRREDVVIEVADLVLLAHPLADIVAGRVANGTDRLGNFDVRAPRHVAFRLTDELAFGADRAEPARVVGLVVDADPHGLGQVIRHVGERAVKHGLHIIGVVGFGVDALSGRGHLRRRSERPIVAGGERCINVEYALGETDVLIPVFLRRQ